MYRVSKMSGVYMAVFETELDYALTQVEMLMQEGTPVILVADLDDLEQLGILPADVEIIR